MTDSIRRRVIAGNWKMYKTVAETRAFFSAFAPLVANSTHCDIVVAMHPGSLDVIGGNVDNSVAMKRVPVAVDGRLAGPDGVVVDPDHPWFVVIRVDYDVKPPAGPTVSPGAPPVS